MGDRAEAELEPGLIGLLAAVPPGERDPIGVGFSPEHTVPLGLAHTAAFSIVSGVGAADVFWVGGDVDVRFLAPASAGDVLVAEAELIELVPHAARFAIHAQAADGRRLSEGTVRLVALHQGRPAGCPDPAAHHTLRSRLAALKRRLLPPPIPSQRLTVRAAPAMIGLGQSGEVEVEIAGGSREETLTVSAEPPFGAGLYVQAPRAVSVLVPARGTAHLRFVVWADRPHEVNLGQPWELGLVMGAERLTVAIAVPDPEPGRVFYVLTEDCETFDGGPATGDYASLRALGNANDFMDAEDYRLQMIAKPNRMNEIAEKHGARWTHFMAVTQRFAAEWAARQSTTGVWPAVVAELDQSVRSGARLHEYAPHLHFGYEPDSTLPPQPRLRYDAATDGLLPTDYWHPESNPTHRYHDWDGAARGHHYLRELGSLEQLDTKAGSLRKSLRHLARLAAGRRAPLGGRTGSFDFGGTPEDQAVSTQAYLANGLRGNSDAYRPGSPCPSGGQLFWCAATDRQRPVDRLEDARLLQLCVTCDTTFHDATTLNRWLASSLEACRGPGVHVLMAMTHAMFMRGEPDAFRSLEGGSFEQLDRHLAWVREHLPEVRFATFSEALLEALDYASPTLEAWTEPVLSGGEPASGRLELPVRLLGRGIRVTAEQPVDLTVRAPALFDGGQVESLALWAGGNLLGEVRGFTDAALPEIKVRLTQRSELRLVVQLRAELVSEVISYFSPDGKIRFHDPPEVRQRDLFHRRPPRPGPAPGQTIVTPDVVRLLMNPLAGHPEPLGRRIHPLGSLTVGAALAAALADAPDLVVERLRLRWLMAAELDGALLVTTESVSPGPGRRHLRIQDEGQRLVAEADVDLGSCAPEAT